MLAPKKPLLLVLVGGLLFSSTAACGSSNDDDNDDIGGGESAFTADDAACFRTQPIEGLSLTEARARCLTAQATRLVDAQIARAEDPRDRALADFREKLRVPAETGCFTEDVRGSLTGLRQNDIDSERDVGMITVQVKAAIEFLKFYYRDLDGYPNHFFDSIEICPNGQVGGDLRLVGSRLRIGVGTKLAGRVTIHTSTALRQLWTRGEHLGDNEALAKLKGIRWSLLDPVGTPRTALRKALHAIIAKLKTRLTSLGEGSEDTTQLRTELTRLVRDETSAQATDDQGRNIREQALTAIGAMSGEGLTKLARDWRAEIERSEIAEGAEEGSVVMSDALNNKDVKITVTQTGFVNVQNVHQIEVDVEAFLPSAANFTRYVETTKTETNVTVNQIGVVNVQTNDVINVRVQVLFGKAPQTASLHRAL